MSNQQAEDFCLIFKHLLSKQIAAYQEIVDRYTAVKAENIYSMETVAREVRWRRYAIAGLKTIRHCITPNTIARWLEPIEQPTEDTANVTADNRLDQGDDQLLDTGLGF